MVDEMPGIGLADFACGEVGIDGRAQQRNAHSAAADVVAVFAVVQDAQAVRAFGKVGPLVAGNLEFRAGKWNR